MNPIDEKKIIAEHMSQLGKKSWETRKKTQDKAYFSALAKRPRTKKKLSTTNPSPTL